jgi:hypothetical protein
MPVFTPATNICPPDFSDTKILCDSAGAFLRVYKYGGTGIISYSDFSLDGVTPYTPTGTVSDCSGSDFEQFIFCDTGTSPPTPFISRVRWDENGDLDPEQTGTFALDGITPYVTLGAVTICGSTTQIEIVCKCDDADGDGVGEVSYREIISIDAAGFVRSLATYNRSMTAAYTPVSPIDCSVPGDNMIAAQPRYKVLSGVGSWVLNTDTAMPTSSVTFTVVTVGSSATPPTVTDFGGTYSLFSGQSVTWSTQYARDVAGLRTPLTLTTRVGDTVAVAWVEEVI